MSGRRLRLAEPIAPDANVDAMRALARALRPYLRELEEQDVRAAALVDVVAMVPSSKRAIMAACRAGKIAGAVRVARRWCAPKASVEAWLRELGPQPVNTNEGKLDGLRSRVARGTR